VAAFLVRFVERNWIWIGLVLFALIFAVFRDFMSGSSGALRIGDCFDVPTDVGNGSSVGDVRHHPCGEPHGAEVFFVGDISGSSDAFPTDADFDRFVKDQCGPAYFAYTGRDFAADDTYDTSYFVPIRKRWAVGDRQVTCLASRRDGLLIVGTVRIAR
jgi:hypothetical protein